MYSKSTVPTEALDKNIAQLMLASRDWLPSGVPTTTEVRFIPYERRFRVLFSINLVLPNLFIRTVTDLLIRSVLRNRTYKWRALDFQTRQDSLVI